MQLLHQNINFFLLVLKEQSTQKWKLHHNQADGKLRTMSIKHFPHSNGGWPFSVSVLVITLFLFLSVKSKSSYNLKYLHPGLEKTIHAVITKWMQVVLMTLLLFPQWRITTVHFFSTIYFELVDSVVLSVLCFKANQIKKHKKWKPLSHTVYSQTEVGRKPFSVSHGICHKYSYDKTQQPTTAIFF